MKKIILITLLLLTFISNSFGFLSEQRRPTTESKGVDIAQCTGYLAVPLVAFFAWRRPGVSVAQKVAIVLAALTAQAAIRTGMEDAAENFRDNSKIVNHFDFNSDGLNDLALIKDLNCAGLVGTLIAGTQYRKGADGSYIKNSDDALKVFNVSRQFYTDSIVSKLPGCKLNLEGEIEGETYERFDIEKYSKDSLFVETDGKYEDSVKIKEKTCETVELEGRLGDSGISFLDDLDNPLVCAYELDGLICSEAVYCTALGVGGVQYTGNGFLEFLTNYLDFSDINGRVADGIDDHAGEDNPQVIECKDECTLSNSGNRVESCSDAIVREDRCNVCYNHDLCVDDEGQIEENCVLKDKYNALTDPEDDDSFICGYDFNPKYLAHCIPKIDTAITGSVSPPKLISPYCGGAAKIINATGQDFDSLAGRIMRCVDQTVKNIFYGSYQDVDLVDGIQQVNLYCDDENHNETPVNSRAECTEGLLKKFQDSVANIITLCLVLAVIFVGILTIFGIFQDIKQIFKLLVLFAIVIYFVRGDAWRDGYFEFLVNGGTEFGQIVFESLDSLSFVDDRESIAVTRNNEIVHLTVDLPQNYRCSFSGDLGPNEIIYAEGETQYRIWDSLDCRLFNFVGGGGAGGGIRAGFSNFISNGFLSIISLSLIGLFVILGVFILLFWIVIKAVFIMASTMVVIMILVLISPLIIPLILFQNKKTRGVFDSWFKQLIGFSLVPIILFMVIAIYLQILDQALYGNQISDIFTVTANGETVISDECNDDFLICFFHKMEKGLYPDAAKSFLGIDLPYLSSEATTAGSFAMLRLLFILFVMFFVFQQIMKNLISNLFDVSVIDKAFEIVKGFGGAALKIGKNGGKMGLNYAKKKRKTDDKKYLK